MGSGPVRRMTLCWQYVMSSVWQINWEDRYQSVLESELILEDTMEPMVWQDIFPIYRYFPEFLFTSQEETKESAVIIFME